MKMKGKKEGWKWKKKKKYWNKDWKKYKGQKIEERNEGWKDKNEKERLGGK